MIFQDDNATPHRARIIEDYKNHHNIASLLWPSLSPDLNPSNTCETSLADVFDPGTSRIQPRLYWRNGTGFHVLGKGAKL